MKSKPNNKRIALILLAILVVAFLLTQTAVGGILLSSPWWVYFVLAGIVLSGYLSVKYSVEDKHMEQEWIENEGNIYMERIEQEKERRKTTRG
ncbi:sporulation YhaL family protein [Halalkalibacter kiskunsagensis]|uniref:Sporulation YhaL family protein n=1 Tax=Halalkalibacter kiskunsagensis TaxID=1548599 RepID=A0ABV6KK51_9BACI